ncbi:hypothetical protein LB467_07245 [Salegentibacter sp. JZCK2]|uniref:hypothetical protein n=1 Tax=Salegentibacter tibetensis TaxID=2873600 RepID=UPI001CCA812B|nr:hypothetical protein [Salegentibacter tibetensis]MBZ9729480.1 hypothetical protein [Salegentibacter tibetensis]
MNCTIPAGKVKIAFPAFFLGISLVYLNMLSIFEAMKAHSGHLMKYENQYNKYLVVEQFTSNVVK